MEIRAFLEETVSTAEYTTWCYILLNYGIIWSEVGRSKRLRRCGQFLLGESFCRAVRRMLGFLQPLWWEEWFNALRSEEDRLLWKTYVWWSWGSAEMRSEEQWGWKSGCRAKGCCWVVEALWLLGKLWFGPWIGWVGTVDQSRDLRRWLGWGRRHQDRGGLPELVPIVWVAQEGFWLVMEQGSQWWGWGCSHGMMEEAISPFSSWAHLQQA